MSGVPGEVRADIQEPLKSVPRTVTPRTRTRPDVKWLANELAALAGQIERIDAELVRLQKRKERLKVVRVALSNVAGQVGAPELPALVPAVKPHEKYGGRGNLRNFIRELLQRAHPLALDTVSLADAVARRFEVSFPDVGARNHFRKYAVCRALQHLRAQGEVERLHNHEQGTNMLGIWRWKAEAPTVDELRGVGAGKAGALGAADELGTAEAAASEGRLPWR